MSVTQVQNPKACPFILEQKHVLCGKVVPGDGRGRSLGFPTANLALFVPELEDGVYAACVRLADGRILHASISVGNNPTFGDVEEQRVEAFVHDLSEDLYGQDLEVALVAKIREMEKFDSVEQLIDQTHKDITVSEAILTACQAGFEPTI